MPITKKKEKIPHKETLLCSYHIFLTVKALPEHLRPLHMWQGRLRLASWLRKAFTLLPTLSQSENSKWAANKEATLIFSHAAEGCSRPVKTWREAWRSCVASPFAPVGLDTDNLWRDVLYRQLLQKAGVEKYLTLTSVRVKIRNFYLGFGLSECFGLAFPSDPVT